MAQLVEIFMHRINVTFSNEIFEKVKLASEKKQISYGQYVRDLVEIGLKVEEAAAQSNNQNNLKSNEIESLGELKILWKNNLSWLLETRYLIRYLIENSSTENREKQIEILDKAKEKALSFVQGLLHEET